MYFDDKALLSSETSAFPGSVGDSCAETSRVIVLDNNQAMSAVLSQFFVEEGELRHPKLHNYVDEKGESWGVDDFSTDQWLALWVACVLFQQLLANRMFTRLCRRALRVGDGTLIIFYPMIWGTIKRAVKKHSWFYDLGFLGQSLLFKLPYRVSDNLSGLEKMSDSSADFLNWFIAGPLFCYRTDTFTWTMKAAMRALPAEKLKERVRHYYAREPHSEWLVTKYGYVIDEVYGSQFGTL